jgi:hypothetical protein
MDALEDISSIFDLTARELEIHQDYLDYFDILQMMKDSNLNACDLDSASVQSLITIMNNDLPLISAYARGMLLKGRHIDYNETVAFQSGVKTYPAYYYLDPQKLEYLQEDRFILFPNPCGDFVIAYFNTIVLDHKGIIILNDLLGTELKKISLKSYQNQLVINLSEYPPGTYVIQLCINNKNISSKLLIKSRK